MNAFITQAQEATKEWTVLNTAFAQEQAKLFQAPLGTPAPDARAVMAGFIKAAEQADEFVVKAAKLADAQSAQLLDAALQGNAAQGALAPVVAGYKNASQTVVSALEQLVEARKALYRTTA